MALLKNSTVSALLNFDQNRNYLRYLIRMQQFPCRDRVTIRDWQVPGGLLYAR